MARVSSHTCADHLERVQRAREFPIHGTTVSVTEDLYRCAVCGEEEYSFEQAVEAQRRAGEIYREQNGFLQPHEVAALRRRLGVTQAQLEDALGLGRKTVARWEAGRVLQTRALDNLLRAIDRFPEVLAHLAERQGVTIDTPPRAAREPRAEAAPGLTLPRSLRARLEQEAEEEGVSLDVYVATLLAQGVERRSTNREVDKLNRKFDDVFEQVSQWETGAMHLDPVEPWLLDHKQQQRNRADKAVAL